MSVIGNEIEKLNCVLAFSWEGIELSVQYENVTFSDSVGFQCKSCGVCCRNQPPDINLKEQHRIEAKGFMNFLENPNDPSNRNIRRNKDGSCFFLTDENKCKIHAIKPVICILDPFIITDFDYRTNRIFLSLNPLATINCKGVSTEDIIPLKEIVNAAQTIVKEFSEIIAKKTGLPVTDKKVASITKKLLRFQFSAKVRQQGNMDKERRAV